MCPGINSFTFWRLTSPSQIGPAGRLAAPGREAQRSGRNRGRTLTAKELTNLTRYRVESKGDNGFRRERTAGDQVSCYVMDSWDFREGFIPFPSRTVRDA